MRVNANKGVRAFSPTCLPRTASGVSSAVEVETMRCTTERETEMAVLMRRERGTMKYVRKRIKIVRSI